MERKIDKRGFDKYKPEVWQGLIRIFEIDDKNYLMYTLCDATEDSW
jgi:hypothetical protein